MAVVIETTLGDITVDLYLEQRPATCLNFLKLCKMKYYNFNLFHTIRSGFIAQTGDPTGEGSGGESIWGLLEGSNKRFFSGEKMPKIRHTDAGLLSMVCTDNMMVGSQFFFTLAPDLDSLDGVHCVIGEVTEGHEVLTKLNEVICDETHRPYQDVRITHTVILEDPFNDLPGLRPPSRSPSPNAERLKGGRIAPDEEIDETQGKSHEEVQEMIEEKEAKARATILEIVGDLPDADIAPPENVLFVCKLNPVTTDDDLEIIFSRFGKIVSCEVIRDKKTGDSLQYAFIEFDDKKSCEDAYFKMDNVLIDDRRIHVDFSQSVSKMRWLGKGRGVQYFNDKDSKPPEVVINRSKRSQSRERNERRQHYRDRENRDKDNSYRNEKKSNNLYKEKERSRSRSRRDISKISHSKHEHSRNDKNHSREDNSKHNKDDYSNKHKNEKRHDNNYDKREYTKNNRKEHSKSPIREKKNNDNQNKYKRDRSNDRHRSNDKHRSNDRHRSNSHKTSKRDARDESHPKEIQHSNNSSRPKVQKEYSKPNFKEASEKRAHTPSPVEDERNNKSKKNDKVKMQKKLKNKVKKNKKRRKPSTSSSESGTSDSSSSSSESSSSSDGHKKKHVSKKRKRCHSSSSSSSSTSSTDSSSTSSSSSSNSSASSSDSDDGKKKRKKNGNKKSGKKIKKL